MVLKILVNNGSQEVVLPWGEWNYKIPAGGKLANMSNDVVAAFMARFPEVGVESLNVETPEEPEPEVKEEKPKKKMGRPKKEVPVELKK